MVVTRLQLVIVGSLGVGEQKAAMKDYMAGLDVYHLSDVRAVLGAPLFPIWEVTNPDAPKPELINQETGARARFAYPHNDCAFMMFACRKKDCCFADFIRCNVYKHEKTLGHFLATEVREKRKRSVLPNIEDNVLVKQFEENQKKFVEQPESPSKVLNKTITIDEDSEDSAKVSTITIIPFRKSETK